MGGEISGGAWGKGWIFLEVQVWFILRGSAGKLLVRRGFLGDRWGECL